MEMTSIAKDFIGLQKQAVNNFFDAVTLIQDQAEITKRFFTKQMRISDEAQSYVDQCRMILKDGRNESKRLVIESITNMENFCDALGSNRRIEKNISASKP